MSNGMGGRGSARGGRVLTGAASPTGNTNPALAQKLAVRQTPHHPAGTRLNSKPCRPLMSQVRTAPSDVLPVWCIGCGQQAATRRHYPYCSGKCAGAAADYELEKVKEAEKPPAKRRKALVKNEWVGGIYTG